MRNSKILFQTFFVAVFIFLFSVSDTHAATMSVNPSTGVYTTGKTFTVSILLNTQGTSVNATDGQLNFNPKELQVVSANRTGSIFNLWTEEPAFSNANGTISFGGGSPTGYKGSNGRIITVVFKPLAAGTPKVTFSSGSILAADGLGTNVLTGMSGGVFTISATTETPVPEYVAPVNTPAAPVVTSETHPNEDAWYKEKTAILTWKVPQDVIAIRTLLDEDKNTIPTIVYDELITEKKIDDLDEGVSYFHIQFKSKEGWGAIKHYRLGVDTEAPRGFTITEADEGSETATGKTLNFTFDDVSPVYLYKIQIDGKEPIDFEDTEQKRKYTLPSPTPGYHTIIAEAFDSAGNSAVATISFTIVAFEKPIFYEYPSRLNTEVIPVLKGKTRPSAQVAVTVRRSHDGYLISGGTDTNGADPFSIVSNENGEFIFIPDNSFAEGVYTVTAIAKDTRGNMSEESDPITIIVEKPGYIVLGTIAINVLSIIVPLIALILLLGFGMWYLWHRLSNWRKKVRKETLEAEASLALELNAVIQKMHETFSSLKKTGKSKFTKSELVLLDEMESGLETAQKKIGKEIKDIEDLVE